jgi:translation initiation factor eIF-2B subunit beta
MDARPMELAIGNIVRRVLFIIREEFATKLAEDSDGGKFSYSMSSSLGGVLANNPIAPDYTMPMKNLMSNIMTQLNELMDELDSIYEEIGAQAEDHIPDGAKILTFGKSRSVELFFRAAAKKQRNFQVIVCESAPYYGGQEMARCLCEAGIETTLIQDAAVFAVMPLIDKVFLPTHAVMANGGLIAPSGGHMVALSAREHSVPLVCITGLFKLCPLYPHDLEEFNELTSPSMVLDYEHNQALHEKADILNPEYDYIPPELLDLYITNTGGHQPSYVYRLLAECYHQNDRVLDKI